MGLPIIRVAGDERWDCSACGVCCRGSIVPLREEERQRIIDQKWEEVPEFRGQTLFVKQSWGSSRYQLAQRPDGRCVFLSDENKCRIHEKFGPEGKPIPCRMFPLQLVPHEKQTVLTLRRACPTAAEDKGRALKDHLSEVQSFVERGLLEVPTAKPPPIQTGGSLLDEEAGRKAERVLAAVSRIFGDERYPPVRRVVHSLRFAALLERAKLSKFSATQVGELVDLIEPSVTSEASPFFADRQRPSNLGMLLFRLTLAEFVRLHIDYRPPTGFGTRGRLLWTMLRMLRGRGNLPPLHPKFPVATFADLETPLSVLDPAYRQTDVQGLLARYLATSALSHQYALANRARWSIVQSIRGLAMTFPLALAMLRWCSAGRAPTANDTALVISALDRGQGFASLSGGRYRTVLGILAWQDDLERLAVWYSR